MMPMFKVCRAVADFAAATANKQPGQYHPGGWVGNAASIAPGPGNGVLGGSITGRGHIVERDLGL